MTIPEQHVPEAGTLRERKKQQTRQALHEAALELIDLNGLDGTTIEQICAAADVSPRTFFNYFPTKAAAALNLPDSALSPEALARFRNAAGDLVPALCDLVGSSTDSGLDRARLKELIVRRPELFPAFTHWMGAIREQFFTLVRERTSSPDVAAAAVALVMTAMSALVHEQSVHDGPADDGSGAQRLLCAVDRIVAVRHAPLATVAQPEAETATEPEPTP